MDCHAQFNTTTYGSMGTNIKLQPLKGVAEHSPRIKNNREQGTSELGQYQLQPIFLARLKQSQDTFSGSHGEPAMQLTNCEPRNAHMSSEMISPLESVASGAATVRLVGAMNY
jgi:hypothetical protein